MKRVLAILLLILTSFSLHSNDMSAELSVSPRGYLLIDDAYGTPPLRSQYGVDTTLFLLFGSKDVRPLLTLGFSDAGPSVFYGLERNRGFTSFMLGTGLEGRISSLLSLRSSIEAHYALFHDTNTAFSFLRFQTALVIKPITDQSLSSYILLPVSYDLRRDAEALFTVAAGFGFSWSPQGGSQ